MIFNELSFLERIYILTSLLTLMSSFSLAVFVFLRNRKSLINRSYAVMGGCIAFWSLSLLLCHTTRDVSNAFFWNRIAHFWTIFIPVTFFNFIIILLGEVNARVFILRIGYVGAVVFVWYLFFSNNFIKGVAPRFEFRVWPEPGIVYSIFLLYFSFYVYYPLLLVYIKFRTSSGALREQLKYIFIGMMIGFMGGSSNYAYFYNVHIPPVGNFFVVFYVFFLAYSIVKHRLMNISVVITKAGIFLAVFTIFLGVPIWVGIKLFGIDLWLIPTILMGIFASIGPSIYLYLRKSAEEKIFQEQRRYQSTLRQAATGMGRIKQLKKLLNLVVYVVTRAVHLEHTLIYLRDDKLKKYTLSAFKSRKVEQVFLDSVPFDSFLVNQLRHQHAPLVLDDLSQKHKHLNASQIQGIRDDIISLSADLVLPIYIEDKLLAFIVFGRKESGKSFTEEDLSVFSSLTNQIALAIENAQFYEEVKRTQEQLFQAEKMATIGTMADGLSHQVNNRFHAMGFIAGDALDTISIIKTKGVPDELKETFDDLERAFTRVQENVVQGGEIVQGLLRYTRKGDAGLTEVDFSDVLKSAFEMAQFKIKTSDLKVMRDFPESMPKIKGNFTQLQEVFFNLIDNAYDAMMQRKSEKAELGFQPTLVIHTKPQGNYLEVIMEDNGIGVKDDDREKLFTPFFTTKLSSKKGTGLGLYVIRKIIEENHGGSVEMISRYMIGTKMKINLPIASK